MTQPLQICTFLWGDKYTPEHVYRLRDMLARNLSIPWEFVLISDREMELAPPAFECSCLGARRIPLWQDMRDAKLCGVRLRAFGPGIKEAIGHRFAWVDLDVVIVSSVDHIFSRPEPFVSAQPPRPPMPINGSLVMMDAERFQHVYTEWTPEMYHRIGARLSGLYNIKAGTTSDEGWMWQTLDAVYGSPTFWGGVRGIISRAEGLYYFRRDLASGRKPLPENASIIIMNGRAFDPSHSRWRKLCPWIADHWREGL